MPDGRILALSGRELAIGDGTRWELHTLTATDASAHSAQVAVADDGQIYTGLPSGIAKIMFLPDGHIQRMIVVPTPNPLMMPTTAIRIEDRWYWYGGVGEVVSWQPGEKPRPVGRITDLERAIKLGGKVYLSDRSDGSFWRETDSGLELLLAARDTNVSNSVTCGIDLGGGNCVVGTNGHGLQHFADGLLSPIRTGGPLAGQSRIGDLCVAGDGLFAAAVDNLGIVFFDRQLRTVQVLDRSLDHRLARVQRLLATKQGTVWGLLNDGVVCVEFPSRISHYESMVSTGLIFAEPYRHQGRLWLIADGQAQRGIYDADGRLLRFDVDTPPGEFLGRLSTETGALLAGGRRGLYRREGDRWNLVLPGLTNMNLSTVPDPSGRWTYAAEGSVGWIRQQGDGYEVATYPAPGIGTIFGSICDAQGILWVELGVSRIARIELIQGVPRFEILGPEDGIGGGWVQLTVLRGGIRANILGTMLRYDAGLHRFVIDTDFAREIPLTSGILGRPQTDTRGNLWVATNAALLLFAQEDSKYRPLEEPFPADLRPIAITPDEEGPVWLHQSKQLLRYDPSIPVPPRAALRSIITQIQLTNTNRTIFLPRGPLAELPFSDNSFVANFLAVGATPSQSVTFEIRLLGASDNWLSNGVGGSITFNRLKEGRYTLQVRPIVQGQAGEIAQLELSIAPPWFRTTTAYAGYAVAALVFIALVAWYASWRERLDKAKLARLVEQRTKELNDANRQLASTMQDTLRQAAALRASEERYRQLSTELERRIAERTEALVHANNQLVASNQELESFSYSISHDLRAPLRNINGFVDLLRRRNRDTLDAESQRFFQIVSTETIRLSQLIDSLLTFARLSRSDLHFERVALASLVAQVIAELRPEYENRILEWKLGPLPVVSGDSALLRQVLVNLLANAIKFTRNRQPAIIEIGALAPAVEPQTEHIMFVRDNGAGFDPKYTAKLFGVFQRLHHTRDFEGTGIGLANAKRIVLRHGGRIWAEGSPGLGATFYIALPVQPRANDRAPAAGQLRA